MMGSDGMRRVANSLNFQLYRLSAKPLLQLANRLLQLLDSASELLGSPLALVCMSYPRELNRGPCLGGRRAPTSSQSYGT